MKRLVPLLLVLGLLSLSCGGDAADPAEDSGGIPALTTEETPDGSANSADDDKKASKKKGPSAKKNKPREGAGSGTADATEPASSGGSGAGEGGGSDGVRGPVAAAPIPAGRYDYATDGRRTISGNSSDLPENTTLTAQSPSNGRQHQVRDLRDGDGNGTVTETHLLYRKDGVYLTYVKVTSKFPGGITDVREFKLPDPELIAPTGGAPGFKTSFSMQGSGTKADVTVSALRYEKVKAGGSTVKTLVVDTRIVFSGSLEGDQRSLSWFYPRHVMVVKEHVRTDVRNGPIRLQSEYEAVLEKLPG